MSFNQGRDEVLHAMHKDTSLPCRAFLLLSINLVNSLGVVQQIIAGYNKLFGPIFSAVVISIHFNKQLVNERVNYFSKRRLFIHKPFEQSRSTFISNLANLCNMCLINHF